MEKIAFVIAMKKGSDKPYTVHMCGNVTNAESVNKQKTLAKKCISDNAEKLSKLYVDVLEDEWMCGYSTYEVIKALLVLNGVSKEGYAVSDALENIYQRGIEFGMKLAEKKKK
jgi:hypothetical protein